MISIQFSKYHGCGNDFILIEDLEKKLCLDSIDIKALCHRKTGIGADGLIVLGPSQVADFQMRYFNADGSYAAMCGNGLRCLIHFLIDLEKIKPLYTIEVGGQVLKGRRVGDKICISLALPSVLEWEVEIYGHRAYVVDVGVPHMVIFSEEDIDITALGRKVNHHPLFAKEGVNVNVASRLNDSTLALATYERGVEEETLACGTGSVAAVFVANCLGLVHKIARVIPLSKEELEVRIGEEVELIGPSQKVFDGQLMLQ